MFGANVKSLTSDRSVKKTNLKMLIRRLSTLSNEFTSNDIGNIASIDLGDNPTDYINYINCPVINS